MNVTSDLQKFEKSCLCRLGSKFREKRIYSSHSSGDRSPIKNRHSALQSLEAIKMLPVTPKFLVTSNVTHFSSMDACPGPYVS